MNYTQRKKNQQAWLQKRGFWMPTLRSFFDLPVTMTQEEWRECAALYVPHGQGHAHAVPAYRSTRLLERLKEAALRHGCSVEDFEVSYNDEYSQIVAKMEKRYAFREVPTRRSTSKYFTVKCTQCDGGGKKSTGTMNTRVMTSRNRAFSVEGVVRSLRVFLLSLFELGRGIFFIYSALT